MRWLILYCVLSVGCAETPQSKSLCAGRECYRVGDLGTDWRAIASRGGQIGYFNSLVGGVIQGNVTCRDDAADVSLGNLTDHLLIGYTERRVRSTALLPFARREALRTVVEAKLDGVPLVLDLYVMKRNGCIFDLSFAAPPDGYEHGLPDFRRFVDGFLDTTRASKS